MHARHHYAHATKQPWRRRSRTHLQNARAMKHPRQRHKRARADRTRGTKYSKRHAHAPASCPRDEEAIAATHTLIPVRYAHACDETATHGTSKNRTHAHAYMHHPHAIKQPRKRHTRACVMPTRRRSCLKDALLNSKCCISSCCVSHRPSPCRGSSSSTRKR